MVVLTPRNNANFQHLRMGLWLQMLVKVHVKSRADLKYQTVTLTVRLNQVGSKRHIFDALGWMHVAEFCEGEQILRLNHAHLQGCP